MHLLLATQGLQGGSVNLQSFRLLAEKFGIPEATIMFTKRALDGFLIYLQPV